MNEQDYLMHYGVKGMKWGVRRYQNPDGTRTSLGRQHEAELKGRSGSSFGDRAKATAGRVKSALTSDKAKKAYKIAGVAVGVAAVATAAYMYGKNKGAVDAAVKNFASRKMASLKDAKYTAQAKAYLAKEGITNSARKAAGNIGNVGSNIADKAKRKASSALTKAGMKARDVGYTAQAKSYLAKEKLGTAAKNAVGTARNVGSNVASTAKNKASSALTKAGMKARDVGYSAQANAYLTRERAGNAARTAVGTARNVGANTVDNLKRTARNTANRATYKRKYQGAHAK